MMRLPVICICLALIGCGPSLREIKDKVAEDALRQYEIVKEDGGNPIDLCVHAGLVAAAYLQAENSSKYSIWKSREAADCAKARVQNLRY
ncbi:MAG: hypothetical protein ABJK59_01990 [Erythrobacter sp.]|uniref:hypothetical protein n=1 Tax=Erythrobacter sp. TaxID=1042 RepID=UPI00329A3601